MSDYETEILILETMLKETRIEIEILTGNYRNAFS